MRMPVLAVGMILIPLFTSCISVSEDGSEAGTSCTADSDCEDGHSCTINTCNTATNECRVAVVPNQCFIQGACLTAGDASPLDACQVCNPSQAQLTWSMSPEGQCGVADDVSEPQDADAAESDDTSPPEDADSPEDTDLQDADASEDTDLQDAATSEDTDLQDADASEDADLHDADAPGDTDIVDSEDTGAPEDADTTLPDATEDADGAGPDDTLSDATDALDGSAGDPDSDTSQPDSTDAGQPCDALEVDDGIACTIDSCDPETGDITHTPDHSLCADDDLCDGIETCDLALGCVEGTPVDIDDAIDCTTDTCDPATGIVTHTPVDADCADDDLCDGVETCDLALGCVEGTPVDIDDAIDCTTDTCDPATGIVSHTPVDADCADDDLCDGIETCDLALGCVEGTPVDVDDDIDCTTDICDPATGTALHIPVHEECPDGDTCMAGTCTPSGCALAPANAGTPCDDANACTTGDACDGGEQCLGVALVCDDGEICTMDSCDELTGCVFENTCPGCGALDDFPTSGALDDSLWEASFGAGCSSGEGQSHADYEVEGAHVHGFQAWSCSVAAVAASLTSSELAGKGNFFGFDATILVDVSVHARWGCESSGCGAGKDTIEYSITDGTNEVVYFKPSFIAGDNGDGLVYNEAFPDRRAVWRFAFAADLASVRIWRDEVELADSPFDLSSLSGRWSLRWSAEGRNKAGWYNGNAEITVHDYTLACGGGCDTACGADNDQDGVPAEADCDDGDPSRYPGAPEVCDGTDNDCNGRIDDGLNRQVTDALVRRADGFVTQFGEIQSVVTSNGLRGGGLLVGPDGGWFVEGTTSCGEYALRSSHFDVDGDTISNIVTACEPDTALALTPRLVSADGPTLCYATYGNASIHCGRLGESPGGWTEASSFQGPAHFVLGSDGTSAAMAYRRWSGSQSNGVSNQLVFLDDTGAADATITLPNAAIEYTSLAGFGGQWWLTQVGLNAPFPAATTWFPSTGGEPAGIVGWPDLPGAPKASIQSVATENGLVAVHPSTPNIHLVAIGQDGSFGARGLEDDGLGEVNARLTRWGTGWVVITEDRGGSSTDLHYLRLDCSGGILEGPTLLASNVNHLNSLAVDESTGRIWVAWAVGDSPFQVKLRSIVPPQCGAEAFDPQDGCVASPSCSPTPPSPACHADAECAPGWVCQEDQCQQTASAGFWESVTPLPQPRANHVAVGLADGSVLVAGGWTAQGTSPGPALATALRFDPTTHTWSSAGGMQTARDHSTAITLQDGRVLVIGGTTHTGPVSNAVDAYHADSNSWETLSSLAVARDDAAAALLPDGRVLVAGGTNGNSALDSCELYDPTTNLWSATDTLPGGLRTSFGIAPLADGSLLAIGGSSGPPGYDSLDDTWRFDPETAQWSSGPLLPMPLTRPALSTSETGELLVVGGDVIDSESPESNTTSAATFALAASGTQWETRPPLLQARTLVQSGAPTSQAGHPIVAGGSLLLANGERIYLDTVERFEPAADRWIGQAPLPRGVANHTLTRLPDGGILRVGGNVGATNAVALATDEVAIFWPGCLTTSN